MKCLKCKKDINYLLVSFVKHHDGTLSIDEYGFEEYEEEPAIQDWEEEKYFCPECDELLFECGDEAINFLKGEKNDESTD